MQQNGIRQKTASTRKQLLLEVRKRSGGLENVGTNGMPQSAAEPARIMAALIAPIRSSSRGSTILPPDTRISQKNGILTKTYRLSLRILCLARKNFGGNVPVAAMSGGPWLKIELLGVGALCVLTNEKGIVQYPKRESAIIKLPVKKTKNNAKQTIPRKPPLEGACGAIVSDVRLRI